MMESEGKLIEYTCLALNMGADNAVGFDIGDIVFDSRVILKCMFGCADYGHLHTCPYQRSPLSMEEYEKVLKKYRWGLVIGCGDKHTSQKISYEIERVCFLDGYYFAFSLSDCGLCNRCAKKDDAECRFPAKARPAFHGVGIDVFKTVRQLGLPIGVLQDKDAPMNWYSAVFVE
jgi:predicted metal-binding protein